MATLYKYEKNCLLLLEGIIYINALNIKMICHL